MKSRRAVEIASVASMLAVIGADLSGHFLALACLLAAAAHAVRLAGWAPLRTHRTPLLWVLHVGYLCLPIGLLLRALSQLGAPLPESSGIHMLTTGCIGSLILGMMARVSLGHTGRPLVAPTPLAWAFGLLLVATAVRAFGVLVLPPAVAYAVAAACWTVAFLAFGVRYAPWLIAPRLDGKPG